MDGSKFWLNEVASRVMADHAEGDIVVSSGVSPSGKYHLGTLREIMTAEAIARECRRRGRTVRHIHVVDDLDVFRKVPAGVPADFDQHLGKPLCDVPAPDGSPQSYADYFVADLERVTDGLQLDMEIVRAHEKYRAGFFVPAIETALQRIDDIRRILVDVSGHQLGDEWSPVQVLEDGYLKTRAFTALDSDAKTITYLDRDSHERTANYAKGEVKLNWRIDWPARWWLLGVQAEPFGRDHATKGGSYDTGEVIAREVFNTEPPLPLAYHFINRTGETKKMSKSAGNVVTAAGLLDIMPPEIIWYFMLRRNPDKQLFFDEGQSLMHLFDDFSVLIAKTDKTPEEQQLLELCLHGIKAPTVSSVPFSHLVASYQASLKDPERTLEVIKRTEHGQAARQQSDTIKRELAFIDKWLQTHAPDDVRFELRQSIDPTEFDEQARTFFNRLAEQLQVAPADADGEWFHKAMYEIKEELNLTPQQMFQALYQVLIGQNSGPRAGWFLSQLDPGWLQKRLRLEG